MTKKIDDWHDDVPETNENEDDEEIIWVSKSEIKRDAEALKDLASVNGRYDSVLRTEIASRLQPRLKQLYDEGAKA